MQGDNDPCSALFRSRSAREMRYDSSFETAMQESSLEGGNQNSLETVEVWDHLIAIHRDAEKDTGEIDPTGPDRTPKTASNFSKFHSDKGTEEDDVTEDQNYTTDSKIKNLGPRVRINVRGLIFETFGKTLERFPNTLLGNEQSRQKYYSEFSNELFFDRQHEAFNSILFYYQSHGILSCPGDVKEEVFREELRFFGINEKLDKQSHEEFMFTDVETLPEPQSFTKKLWYMMEYPSYSYSSRIFSWFLIILIFSSTLVLCFSTTPSLQYSTTTYKQIPFSKEIPKGITDHNSIWSSLEIMSVIFLSLDFFLRFGLAPNRIAYALSPFGAIDFLPLLPSYIHIALSIKAKTLNIPEGITRLIAFLRIFRVLKLTRYSKGLQYLSWTIRKSKELSPFTTNVIVCVIFFATILFAAEHRDNEVMFDSIPSSFWYTIITMITVGYGDVVTITLFGKIVSTIAAIWGIILLINLPTPLFLYRFHERYSQLTEDKGEKGDIAETIKELQEMNQRDLRRKRAKHR